MTRSLTMTVRISPEIGEKLDTLARDMRRSKSFLAGEAIAAYIEHNAWQVARIKEALVEARSGTPGVPHEAVTEWVESWGTEKELPRPVAKS